MGYQERKLNLKRQLIFKKKSSYNNQESVMRSTTTIFIRKLGNKPPLNLTRTNFNKGVEKSEDSIYGLDVNFLREIGKQDLIEEYEQEKQKLQENIKHTPAILALEIKHKKVNKLREICKELRTINHED